jgi:hypothetical protein
MGRWRPIATAPKDETEVLLIWKHLGLEPRIGKWIPEWDYEGEGHAAGWFVWGPYVSGYCIEPTHWHPIPAMPPNTPSRKNNR